MFKAIKQAINDFLNKLANENKKSFGNERLDCCKLDRPNDKKDN